MLGFGSICSLVAFLRSLCNETTAYTVTFVIACMLDVGSVALLEGLDAAKLQRIPSNVSSRANLLLEMFPLLQQLDIAKLQRIPSNVSSLACVMLEVLLSWSASMQPNYSVYRQMCHRMAICCWKCFPLLEQLDVAKLQRIPSNVSSCAHLVSELLLSWSGSMAPNYSVYR